MALARTVPIPAKIAASGKTRASGQVLKVHNHLAQAFVRGFDLASQFGAALHKGCYDVGIGHKRATVQFMGQRLALLEQLAAARRQEAGANIKAQLDIFVSGMVVGSAMTKAEDVLKTSELALQSHLSDIKRILDDLDKLPLFDGDAQS